MFKVTPQFTRHDAALTIYPLNYWSRSLIMRACEENHILYRITPKLWGLEGMMFNSTDYKWILNHIEIVNWID